MSNLKMWHTTSMILSLLAASALASGVRADPLHKVGAEGAWQHEGSGWMFSKRVAGSERVGVPYTIDGNDDVGVQYEIPSDGSHVTATVEIYRTDSAANGAQLQNSAAMRESSESFTAGASPERTGIKTGFDSENGSRASLYRFTTTEWIVVVRTLRPSGKSIDAGLDAFVRALPWESLGSDTSGLHNPGS